jgi:hypothetical protein
VKFVIIGAHIMLLIKYLMKIIAGEPFSSDSYLEVKNAMV